LNTALLVLLCATAAASLVEGIKHLTNFGASDKYNPVKGLFHFGAPLLLAGLNWIAENQGASIDLLGRLGVHTSNATTAAVVGGLLAGLAAPQAYDLQQLLKGLVTPTPGNKPVKKASAKKAK